MEDLLALKAAIDRRLRQPRLRREKVENLGAKALALEIEIGLRGDPAAGLPMPDEDILRGNHRELPRDTDPE